MQILIVNNHQGQTNFIKQGLRYENFGIDTGSSETECLTKLLYHQYNALVLKHAPPEINAVSLSRQIRNLTPRIPIVVLSEINTPDLREQVRSLKNTILLIKPFSFYKLSRHLKELALKYFYTTQTKELKFEDLILNINTHEARRRNQNFLLRNKEFSLLEFLMLNRGKVISRNELLEQVWDRNTNIFTNTVDVHIKNLRHKIDRRHDRKLIQTVHGIGYKLG